MVGGRRGVRDSAQVLHREAAQPSSQSTLTLGGEGWEPLLTTEEGCKGKDFNGEAALQLTAGAQDSEPICLQDTRRGGDTVSTRAQSTLVAACTAAEAAMLRLRFPKLSMVS